MLNILITSVGRRYKLIEYFKKEFFHSDNIILTDCDEFAPALKLGDKQYIVPRIESEDYINKLVEICLKEEISAIFSLIDPEQVLLSKYKPLFDDIGVKLISSRYEINELCLDKYKMYQFCINNKIQCAKTYLTVEDFIRDLEKKEVSFPIIVKPRFGSASFGVTIVENLAELNVVFLKRKDLIIQHFLKGQEFGVDCFTDLISKEIISIFIKEKIKMRAGETDKAISVKDDRLVAFVSSIIYKLDLIGMVDIDVFNISGEWYLSEINPRFGGGYPLAYECGQNYPKYIKNNLNGVTNDVNIGGYKENIVMAKFDDLLIYEIK